MVRCITCCVFAFLVVLPLQAQEEEVLGKKRTEWLKMLKEHKDTKYRRAAVIALGIIGARSAGVLPGLLEAMENDPEADVRREIAAYLGSLGADAKGTVDALALRLEKDKSEKVREAAARSLGRLADYAPVHVTTLGRALKDPSAEARSAAAEALKHFGEKAKIVVGQLQEAAQDRKLDRFTRLYAVQILAKQGGEDAKTAKALLNIMLDNEAPPALRQAAVNGLGDLVDTASVPQLASLLGDAKQDLDLRRIAAVALTRMGDKASPSWPVAKHLLTDNDTGLRYQAVRIAGQVGKQQAEAIKSLIDRLPKESNSEVLVAIVQELGELSARDAIEPLTRLTRDNRPSIREAAEEAIKRIKSPGSPTR